MNLLVLTLAAVVVLDAVVVVFAATFNFEGAADEGFAAVVLGAVAGLAAVGFVGLVFVVAVAGRAVFGDEASTSGLRAVVAFAPGDFRSPLVNGLRSVGFGAVTPVRALGEAAVVLGAAVLVRVDPTAGFALLINKQK